MQKRSPTRTTAATAKWCYFTVYNSSKSTYVQNSSYLFMHVSCPMVLVINPIASSSDGDDGAGTSNDGAGNNDGNGNDRATVAMDDAGEAVAGAAAAATSLGGGVEIVVVIGSSSQLTVQPGTPW